MEEEEEARNSPIVSNDNIEEDRISNLPDCLIHHILSSLDMTYVLRTSVLSTRWRYIWTSLSALNLDSDLCKFEEDEKFDFVDRLLMLRDSSDIKHFHLDWSQRHPEIATRLNTWILGAVKRNVQDLSISLNLWEAHKFKLPPTLFSCKSLTKLTLDLGLSFDSTLSLPKSMMNFHLPMLKYLKLSGLSVYKGEVMTKLFSSCPVLESLIIKNCCVNLDNVYAPKLKYFKVKGNDYGSEEGNMIRLYAPNLTSFVCGSCLSHDYALESVSSLVTADFRMSLEDNDDEYDFYSRKSADVKKIISQSMMKLLRDIHSVKDLIFPDCFLQVISGASKLFEQPPQFFNLRILELQTYLRKSCFPAIAYLLKVSPNIESLYVSVNKDFSDEPLVYPFFDEIISDPQDIGDDWETELSLPCMMHHLKFVKLIPVQGRVNELKFLELLLRNAMVLERIILCCEWGPGKTTRRLMNFCEKLHTLPRVSSAVTFMCF